MNDSLPAPFDRYEGVVLPEWIDNNGHMNLAYYIVLFDQAVDLLFGALGYAAGDRAETGHGPFAVETHTQYRRELMAGEAVRISAIVAGADDKRLHIAFEMFRVHDGQRAATQELLYLNVDLASRRVTPFAAPVRARLADAVRAHSTVPRPDWLGRCIAMPLGY